MKRQAKWLHRTAKQDEAKKRKEASALTTIQQKLAKLDAGRYRAIKERTRLLAQAVRHESKTIQKEKG